MAIDEDDALSKAFTVRMTAAERDGLDWLAGERTREVREAAKLRTAKVTQSDALRELLRNELERRKWAPGKPGGKRA